MVFPGQCMTSVPPYLHQYLTTPSIFPVPPHLHQKFHLFSPVQSICSLSLVNPQWDFVQWLENCIVCSKSNFRHQCPLLRLKHNILMGFVVITWLIVLIKKTLPNWNNKRPWKNYKPFTSPSAPFSSSGNTIFFYHRLSKYIKYKYQVPKLFITFSQFSILVWIFFNCLTSIRRDL